MTDNVATEDSVVIERILDAPVEVVWRLWTEERDFAEWYGPDGATIPVARCGGLEHGVRQARRPAAPEQVARRSLADRSPLP